MRFRNKIAYVWGLRYRWNPSLSRNLNPRFPHFVPPCMRVEWNTTSSCKNYSTNVLSIDRVSWPKKYPKNLASINMVGISLFRLADHGSHACPSLPPLLRCFPDGWEHISAVLCYTLVAGIGIVKKASERKSRPLTRAGTFFLACIGLYPQVSEILIPSRYYCAVMQSI